MDIDLKHVHVHHDPCSACHAWLVVAGSISPQQRWRDPGPLPYLDPTLTLHPHPHPHPNPNPNPNYSDGATRSSCRCSHGCAKRLPRCVCARRGYPLPTQTSWGCGSTCSASVDCSRSPRSGRSSRPRLPPSARPTSSACSSSSAPPMAAHAPHLTRGCHPLRTARDAGVGASRSGLGSSSSSRRRRTPQGFSCSSSSRYPMSFPVQTRTWTWRMRR